MSGHGTDKFETMTWTDARSDNGSNTKGTAQTGQGEIHYHHLADNQSG